MVSNINLDFVFEFSNFYLFVYHNIFKQVRLYIFFFYYFLFIAKRVFKCIL